jgi:hypothetical protein
MQSPDIKEAKTLNEYKILLTFINGEQKVFDLKPYLNYPVFKPLNDINEFNNFIIEDGTIEWKCGADLSPDTFYIESTPLTQDHTAMGN